MNETLFQDHEARHTTWDEDAYNKTKTLLLIKPKFVGPRDAYEKTHTILQIKPKFVGPLLNSVIT